MNKLLVLVILLLVALGVLAYTQGWFNIRKDEKGHVQVKFDKEKFKKDKEAAKKYLAEKKHAAEKKIADLRNKSKGAKGDEKTKLDSEIADLNKSVEEMEKHDKE